MTSTAPGPVPGWGPAAATPMGARDVVTGEAVALELRLAKLPSRALALFLDLLLMAIPLIGIGALASVAASGTDEALGAAIVLLSLVGVLLGYPVLFETFSRGRSPGKAALGLRVVRDDGGPVRFRHAMVRALLGVFVDFSPMFAGVVGPIVSLSSSKGKRVGDMLAGTVVIRERIPVTFTPPAVMPPHLAGWATALPVTRLPDALALDARQVLSRLTELEPDIGRSLTSQLAGEVIQALGTPPPAGSDPVSVLSAVLAERRNRELARAGVPAGPAVWGPTQPEWGSAQPPWGPPQAAWGPPQPSWGPPQPGWGTLPAPAPAPVPGPTAGAPPVTPPAGTPPEPPPPGPFALPG